MSTKLLRGTVVWFDKSSGEGMVQAHDGGPLYYVHYSCIRPVAKRRDLEARQQVEFTLYRNLYSERVETIRALEATA